MRLTAGVRLSGAVWRTARQLALLRTSASFPGSDGVAAFPGGAGIGANLQQTSTSTSTPKRKPFLRHGA
ncbi:hypothetical protein [Pectobacterium araliae]|uniref:hypothetical protein n=1 Tax=Pectobacterium araliae TaxID=3073862 RepID=UPI0021C413C5